MARFKLGDRLISRAYGARPATVRYAGARVYVLETSEDEHNPPWEFTETVGFVDRDYDLAPETWEAGRTYVQGAGAKTTRRFHVTATDTDGNALGYSWYWADAEAKYLAARRSEDRADWEMSLSVATVADTSDE